MPNKKMVKDFDSIAKDLKRGMKYEDLQDQMEDLIGPLDGVEVDPELDEAWELNNRDP